MHLPKAERKTCEAALRLPLTVRPPLARQGRAVLPLLVRRAHSTSARGRPRAPVVTRAPVVVGLALGLTSHILCACTADEMAKRRFELPAPEGASGAVPDGLGSSVTMSDNGGSPSLAGPDGGQGGGARLDGVDKNGAERIGDAAAGTNEQGQSQTELQGDDNAAGAAGGEPSEPDIGVLNVLVFTKTAGYRHDSIPDAIEALRSLADEQGWTMTATEDGNEFSRQFLDGFDVVVFANTSEDVLTAPQQDALQSFVQAGGGFVGIHAASDTEYDWPWYGELVGAYFRAHPRTQNATIRVEDAAHPATRHLPNEWSRIDEWYGFRVNPRPGVRVLLSLDESSYSPEESSMSGDHPIAWCQDYEGGRAFYTGLGHTRESYAEPDFIQHLLGGIRWASGRPAATQ